MLKFTFSLVPSLPFNSFQDYVSGFGYLIFGISCDVSSLMSRRPRIHFPGAVYHIISRGNQKQTIFKDSDGYHRFRTLLEQAQARYAFKLYAYVLMPNHFHLLVEVKSQPLAKIMQTVLYRYTHYFNKRHRKVGHLFQGRYRAILCDKDSYLLELVRYLHLNPVRAGLVKDAIQYRWSSHTTYLRGKNEGGIPVEEVLSIWSKRRAQAKQRYSEFISDGISQGHRDEYYQVKQQRFLGDEKFLEKVEKEREHLVDEAGLVGITIEQAVEQTVHQFGGNMKLALDTETGHRASQLRAIVCYVGRKVGGIRFTEMARYFKRDLSTLSLRVKKLEGEMSEDLELRQQIHQLCEALRKGRKPIYQITKA